MNIEEVKSQHDIVSVAGQTVALKKRGAGRRKMDNELLEQYPVDRENILTSKAKKVFQKYLKRNHNGEICETVRESFERVAWGIAKEDKEPDLFYNKLLDAMVNLQLIPNRPAWFGLGDSNGLTSACTVIDIQDDLGREKGSILHSLRDIGMIQQSGGGVGQNWSKLRPKGALVSRTGRQATGPIVFLKAFNALLQTIQQGGVMMGANNAGMLISHPDIIEFIRLKLDEYALTLYNTNIMITDDFMEAVLNDGTFALVHNEKVYTTMRARFIFDEIVNAIYINGGLGVQFYDTAQRANAIPGLGDLVSTNPCGEYWLFDKESCNLSYINLPSFYSHDVYDWAKLESIVRLSTRMLDNLIDANAYIPEIPDFECAAKHTRRLGNGITGLADLLILFGVIYGTKESADVAGQIEEFILWHSIDESVHLARQLGSFPAITKSIFKPDNFQFQKPKPLFPFTMDIGRPELDWGRLIQDIKRYGIRNCGFTSIPPASFGGDTMSTEGYGCEPIFSDEYTRQRRNSENVWWIQGYTSDLSQSDAFITAHNVPPEGHLLVQAALQRFVTEAITKTVNLAEKITQQEIGSLIIQAWKLGIKGLCFYRSGSRDFEVLKCKQCQVIL